MDRYCEISIDRHQRDAGGWLLTYHIVDTLIEKRKNQLTLSPCTILITRALSQSLTHCKFQTVSH